MADNPIKRPLTPTEIRAIRLSNTLRNSKYSAGGNLKANNGNKAAPINLRLPPEKR